MDEVVTFCLPDDSTLVCSRSAAVSNEKIAALLRSGMRDSESPVRIPISHGRRAVATFVFYLSVGREVSTALVTRKKQTHNSILSQTSCFRHC